MTATEKQKNNQTDYLAERVKSLAKGDAVSLRRSFGNTLSEASGDALAAFYKICPQNVKNEEAAYLSACSIAYILHYGNGKKTLADCLKSAQISESRIKALLGNKFVDKDGFFHSKYSRLVRYVVSKGFIPDINEIYSALTEWEKYRISFTKEYFSENNINDSKDTNNNNEN